MSLDLRVTIDPRSGFCFGVIKAIQRAEQILKEEGKLYCLGQIVHNDEEVKRLEQLGMKTITHEELGQLHNQKILIRAHGEPPETYRRLEMTGNEVIDATCPIVLKLQERVKKAQEKEEHILIFGKKDHPEVKGLMGHLEGKGVVFERFEELDVSKLPKTVTLYSQTTMNVDQLYSCRDQLEEQGIRVKLKDTVCRQVSGRQDDMSRFCRDHDVIIFVAGRNSSNGKMLFSGCSRVNSNSHKLSSIEEIKTNWFKPGDSVGICGATSTPTWLMEEVKSYLQSL